MIKRFPLPIRDGIARWVGSIGCRVSFFMVIALFLIAALVGAVFFLEARRDLDEDVRERASYAAREVAALAADDLASGNLKQLSRVLSAFFFAHDRAEPDGSFQYLLFYDRNCNLVAGSNGAEMLLGKSAAFSRPAIGDEGSRPALTLDCSSLKISDQIVASPADGLYDLVLPAVSAGSLSGYVRVGVSDRRDTERFFGSMKESMIALLGILLVGLVFSQIIAHGITRPIQKLSAAAERVAEQQWDAPFPDEGSNEISKLGIAFNQMAQTLKLREESLSQGNRDLFILHTAGLDLMESIDRNALIVKISARVEDLVKADTIAVSGLDRSDRMLKYLGIYGNKAKALGERELPIEAGGIYNWLASYGTPIHITDAQSDALVDREITKTLGIRSIIAVPLWSSNALIGILTAVNKKGGASFDKHDLRLMTVFANLAAAALQNSLLYSDLKNNMDELKSAQEQLVRSTKMAAIGELSTNLAHEINNPLTSVLGYTTHLLKTLDLSEPSRKMLGMVEQETLRVRKIIRNLLDFARQRPAWMQQEDLTIPLRETVALVQGVAAASSITIRESYPDRPVLASIDHNEMKQVFINIVNNALHAMPQGGELAIRLREATDHHAIVEFSDTGVGISPEHLHKIFEPFFSTKENGDGTGLGLSISYRIVQQHGGKIEAESVLGRGAVFRVFLPATPSVDRREGVECETGKPPAAHRCN